MKKATKKSQKNSSNGKTKKTISYRLKSKVTANGLSHYVMYGDVKDKKALL